MSHDPSHCTYFQEYISEKIPLSSETAYSQSFPFEERVCKTECENSKQKGTAGVLWTQERD